MQFKNFVAIIHFTFLIILSGSNFAQSYRFSHIGVKEGLSNQSVNCFAQDSTGFIWIGTSDGLNRFDGNKFKIFVHRPSDSTSIITNTINDLLAEGDNLWVCTNKGIDFFDAENEVFKHIPIYSQNKLLITSILKVYKDLDHNLLIATHKGIFKYRSDKKAFYPFYFNNQILQNLANSEVTYILQDRDRLYWIGTLDLGVFVFNPVTNEVKSLEYFENTKNQLLNNKIFCIYEDNLHTIWIGTNEGLFAYSKTTGQIKRFMPQAGRSDWLPHISVNRIIEDTRNNLWLATNGGLSKYNRSTGTFINYLHNDFDETTISNNSIHAIFEDAQKNIWLGSGESGVDIYKAQTIEFETFKKRLNHPLSLNYGYVLSILEDQNGDIWIGTNGWGINKFERKNGRFKYFKPPTATKVGNQTGAILCLFEDKKGRIWIGTYLGGLTVYDPSTGKYKLYAFDPQQPEGLSNNNVTYVIEDSKGNIWIATNGGGVNIYRPETDNFQHIRASNKGLSSDFCTILKEDSKGNIWIGTFFGLNCYNPVTEKNTVYLNSDIPGSISSDVIFSICEDSKGQLWFGTEFGLNLFHPDKGTFSVFTTDNGLPNNVINGILEDHRGFLWISTNKGLCRFDPQTNFVIHYDVNDGLASTTFFHGAYFKGKSGYFYFGGSEGVTYFNPDRIRQSNYKAPLVLTDFYLYNQSIKPSSKGVLKKSIQKVDKIELSHDQAFIGVEFASLNYISANKVNYSYFLHGIDRQWNHVGNKGIASYTNLPAGEYDLIIKAQSEDGIESQRTLKIIVYPPFYQSRLAYLIYFIVIILVAYFIYSYIHTRTVYKHKLEIERIEKEKAIELNQAKLKFYLNVSHEFKTPLTLILSPIEKLISSAGTITQEEANYLYHLIYRNALRLYRLINQIMDIRKIDEGNIKLHVTENEIVDFIREICLSFEEHARIHSIDFKIDCPFNQLHVWFDLDKIEKVIYNLLSNAFRYTPDGKSITVKLESGSPSEKYPEGYICISVIDEGIGIPEEYQEKIFTRFFQVETETIANPASSGVGLALSKEFVEMHRGEITVESVVNKGSKFSIILPLGKNHFNANELVKPFEIKVPKDVIYSEESIMPLDQKSEVGDEFDKEKKKYKILIAEDNYELRIFLMNNLKEHFQVFEASNGAMALQLTREYFPDIIISDIMMPELNGIELCKAIKSDLKTSHIPVILLTVLNSMNNQLEGLEIGADDYITKPFNLNLLKARIYNLIETRKKLIRKFIEDIKPDANHLTQNPNDEKFLKRAFDIIEKNLSNTEFTAEDFADQIGMSRSNLHIKLKALTNLSATEFIRLYRLKKAAELLTTHAYNISEVSYMVGFNSISYFNRCFKQQFGVTPSEFVESSKS